MHGFKALLLIPISKWIEEDNEIYYWSAPLKKILDVPPPSPDFLADKFMSRNRK